MIFTGSGDFIKQGQTFLDHFVQLGGLQPKDRVLDIGSGIGRMAIPMTQYLSEGSYEGFDIVPTGIDWCKKNVESKFPNFKFTLTTLSNDLYTSNGENASQFKFPYKDEDFNFSFLTSVFTHMQPEEVENYLREIARTLKKGGTCFATFFVLNDVSERAMEASKVFYFKHDYGNYALMDDKVKSANIAFKEDYLKQMIEKAGLQWSKMYAGKWSGNQDGFDFQDIVILRK